jgi:hypothetical protein
MDRQLLRQKSRKESSVKKKQTGISRKLVCYGILIQVLS